MEERIKANGKHVSFATLISLLRYKYMSVRTYLKQSKYSTDPKEGIFFLKFHTASTDPQYGDTQLSSGDEIRFTPKWEVMLLQFLQNGSINERKPDGKTLIHSVRVEEPSNANIVTYNRKGDPEAKYYRLKDCHEFFKNAYFQRVEEIEDYGLDLKPLIIYEEDLNKPQANLHSHFIPMVMNKHEEVMYWRKKDTEQARLGSDKWLYNWQDNPEDYWNID